MNGGNVRGRISLSNLNHTEALHSFDPSNKDSFFTQMNNLNIEVGKSNSQKKHKEEEEKK